MKPCVLVVCNALDDLTLQQRGIKTDSPAATRKVFLLSESLRLAGARPYVLSLGRGRRGGRARYFPGMLRRVNGVAVYYAPYATLPIISEVLSLFGLLGFVYATRKSRIKATIFYNRKLAYLPALLLSHILGYENILDLEDGEVDQYESVFNKIKSRWLIAVFDRLCNSGALLACTALADFTSIRPTLCYYGSAIGISSPNRWTTEKVSVLMGGSLSPQTGGVLLMDCIRLMRKNNPHDFESLIIEVTGGGECLKDFKTLAAEPGFPEVLVHGRTSNIQYNNILQRCDVGLALKLNSGLLANTTFPSKVVEFAASGMLVVTTDISDVRKVLGDGALYLQQDEPEKLLDLFRYILKQRVAAKNCAMTGLSNINRMCAPKTSGEMVFDFIFGDRP